MVEFEKAKLADGKNSFKSAETKKGKGQFQDQSRGNKAIQLERLGKKSPDAYKKVMDIDHKAQRVLGKVQVRNKKFEQRWRDKASKDLRPVNHDYRKESSGNIQTKVDKSVNDKMANYEKSLINIRDKQINAIGKKHGIDLGYGKGQEKTKNNSR